MENINTPFQWWLVLARSFHGHLLSRCFFVVVVYRLVSETCLFLPIHFHVSCNCVLKWQKSEPKQGSLSRELVIARSGTIFSVYVPAHHPAQVYWRSKGQRQNLLRKGSVFCWVQWASLRLKKISAAGSEGIPASILFGSYSVVWLPMPVTWTHLPAFGHFCNS